MSKYVEVKAFQAAGEPVISVDTKKKELVGDFKNDGRELRPKGPPPSRAHWCTFLAEDAKPCSGVSIYQPEHLP
jgi:hypothetical protein